LGFSRAVGAQIREVERGGHRYREKEKGPNGKKSDKNPKTAQKKKTKGVGRLKEERIRVRHQGSGRIKGCSQRKPSRSCKALLRKKTP